MIGTTNGTIKAFSYNPFFKNNPKYFYSLDVNLTTVKEVFPDKLIDLNGYNYRAVIYENIPRTGFAGRMLVSEDYHFMLTVTERQNASLQLLI